MIQQNRSLTLILAMFNQIKCLVLVIECNDYKISQSQNENIHKIGEKPKDMEEHSEKYFENDALFFEVLSIMTTKYKTKSQIQSGIAQKIGEKPKDMVDQSKKYLENNS